MDAPLTGFNKKKQKKSSSYSISTFEISKPRGNKYLSFDFATLKKKLGEDESDQEDERFHDRDAREMVRRLEEKYGNKKTKSGRKKRFTEDDFIDKSLGYDLEDNFIDDTEAHDELVPSTLDTKKGGFYVNKGKLEFVSIGDECSEESEEDGEDDDEDDEDRPKKWKKKEDAQNDSTKPVNRAPKRPDLNDEETSTTNDNKAKKRAAISSSSSDSDSEREEREEGRLVGGPPTLKRSKPSAAVGSPLAKKTEERKEEKAEPRRMAGAPPTLPKKKPDVVARPSLIGKPPTTAPSAATEAVAEPAKMPEPIPLETVSSEDEIQLIEDPPQEAPPLPVKVNMADIPSPVQLQIFQFEQLCSQHVKPGKKQVPQILIEKAIEVNELTGRLGMKKTLRGVVLEKMAEMCGYSKPGLQSRMNTVAARSAPSTSQSSQLQPVQQAQSSGISLSEKSASTTISAPGVSTIKTPVVPVSASLSGAVAAKPRPEAAASVIGLKPATAVAAPSAAQPKKPTMIGKWTEDQVQMVMRTYPHMKSNLNLFTQHTFDEFLAAISQQGAILSANPTSKLEEARKSYPLQMNARKKSDLMVLYNHKDIDKVTDRYKASLLAKYPQFGDKAIILMDFHDSDLSGTMKVFAEFGKAHLGGSPIQYLAFLDDVMKKYFGDDGRTDRLVRHFTTRIPEMDAIRLLPEFIHMGQVFNKREKELHALSPVKTPLKTGEGITKPKPPAPDAKNLVKPPQTMPSSSKQQLQLQQENGNAAALLAKMPPQLQAAFLSSIPSTSAQNASVAQQMMILQAIQQQIQEATVKKAKDDEERRIAIGRAKAEEAEKRRKEKEEAMALKKAQREDEKRLEREKKQREAEEERRRKEEEKAKRIEEERQRRMREEEEKERRRKEEAERKLREEAEKKRIEEEMARKREQIRIKQEEEKRLLQEKERQQQLREEEERAALLLAEEVSMERDEMEGVFRPLTETEEVEVAEEEARKREREQQVVAAREAAVQRSNSMAMARVKQEPNDKELLDSFFMGTSSTEGTVCGPVSREVNGGDPSRSHHSFLDQKGPMMMQQQQQSHIPLQQHSSPAMQSMIQSPQMSNARFQNGGQYAQIPSPSALGSPYGSHASPLQHASPLTGNQSSPMMNASPSQMIPLVKTESPMQRHNSFSSMSHSHGSPMQQPQLMHQPQQMQQSHQTFFPSQPQQPTNGMPQQQPIMQQPIMQHQQQPIMQQQQQPILQQQQQQTMQQQHQIMQQQQQKIVQQQPVMQQQQQQLFQPSHSPMQQPQQQVQRSSGMGIRAWQQPMQQQQSQQIPSPQQPQQPVIQQPSQMQQQQQEQQRMGMILHQKQAAERERQYKMQQLQQQQQAMQQQQQLQQQQQQQQQQLNGQGMAMPQAQTMMGVAGQMSQRQMFPNQQLQQAQPQLNAEQMRQMALLNQQNAQMGAMQRSQQNQNNSNMNRFY